MRWIAFGSGTKRTARCHAHMSKSGRVRVVMGLRLFPVPRAVCVDHYRNKNNTLCAKGLSSIHYPHRPKGQLGWLSHSRPVTGVP